MNLGLDIDDTITAYPKRFTEMARKVKLEGGQVHIVTSRTDNEMARDLTKKELSEYGLVYDKIYFLPSFGEAAENCPHKDLDWYQKYLWQKVNYCEQHGIDEFYDDDSKVIELFERFEIITKAVKV